VNRVDADLPTNAWTRSSRTRARPCLGQSGCTGQAHPRGEQSVSWWTTVQAGLTFSPGMGCEYRIQFPHNLYPCHTHRATHFQQARQRPEKGHTGHDFDRPLISPLALPYPPTIARQGPFWAFLQQQGHTPLHGTAPIGHLGMPLQPSAILMRAVGASSRTCPYGPLDST